MQDEAIITVGTRVVPTHGVVPAPGVILEIDAVDDEYLVRWPWRGSEESTDADSHTAWEQAHDIKAVL